MFRRVRAVPSGRPASFAAIDRNRDGKLDLDEIKKAAAALFDELDIDRKGVLTRSKLRRRLSGKDLASAGMDRSETLTKDQYLSIVELRFEAADADHDGTISRSEFYSTAGLALRRLFY
jgi:Ca2+-binding EF-hand superfamily protein